MDEKTYRIKVNLKSGEIEVEGDKEFVKEEIRNLIEEMKQLKIIQSEFKSKIEEEISEEIRSSEKIEEVAAHYPAVIEKIPYESFAELYKDFYPQKEQEKALIAVYWLNKKLGKEKVAPKDVSSLLTDASIKLPSSISRDLRVLASGKKAYLIKLSKTAKGKTPEYKISMTGENYIKARLQKRESKE